MNFRQHNSCSGGIVETDSFTHVLMQHVECGVSWLRVPRQWAVLFFRNHPDTGPLNNGPGLPMANGWLFQLVFSGFFCVCRGL